VLSYEEEGPKGAPSIVLVHGWPLDKSIWSVVSGRVARAGFRVLAPDLPGFGASPPLEPDEPTVESFASSVAAFLRTQGAAPVGLAGHSFGGYVALALAEAHPRTIAGLALVSSRTIADSEAARRGREETIAKVSAQGTRALLPGLAEKLLARNAESGWVRAASALIEKAHPDGVVAALQAMARRPDRSLSLERFPGPLLVIHGEADELIPITEAAKPRAPVGRVLSRVLPKVGHMPMWEAPKETADALIEWARAAFHL